MASLIAKWQKCGKHNCRCNEGFPHGPYFWLVTYISKNSILQHRGKYHWQYLGKNPQDVWTKLEYLDSRFTERYSLEKMHDRIVQLKKQIVFDGSSRYGGEIFVIKDT